VLLEALPEFFELLFEFGELRLEARHSVLDRRPVLRGRVWLRMHHNFTRQEMGESRLLLPVLSRKFLD
jgi:hypothetical protein